MKHVKHVQPIRPRTRITGTASVWRKSGTEEHTRRDSHKMSLKIVAAYNRDRTGAHAFAVVVPCTAAGIL